MNTYIKQLIDAYGNNLIPVSGTASCYNPDGKNVDELFEDVNTSVGELETTIETSVESLDTRVTVLENNPVAVELVTNITWAGLKALKSSKLLSPGTIYCITDYKTVSTQSGTTTTGNGVQILVQALSENTLSEDALGLLSNRGSSGSSQDVSSGTITVKKLIMGDNKNEENPGVYMIDEGSFVYLFHDMFEFNGTTYYRWMRYFEYGEIYDYDDFYYPVYNTSDSEDVHNSSRPIFILTETDDFNLSGGQYYEPDFSISYDNETAGTEDYSLDKVIMGVEEVTVPLILFGDKFNKEDESDPDFPLLPDAGAYYVYAGTINLDGTTYYKWHKWNNSSDYTYDSDQYYIISDTLEYTFPDDIDYYPPYGYMTYDDQEMDYSSQDLRIVDSNYKSAFGSGGGSGKIEILDLKYSLENDTTRFSWASKDITVDTLEIYTDDDLWFTNSRTANIDGTTYYIWENNNFIDEEDAYLLSTTLELENGDSLDRISQDLDPETISQGYSVITDARTGTKTISSATGVIYWMRDANNNQAPYDFKNILFNGHYTFDLNGTDFSGSCYNNTIQSAYEDGKQVLNRVTFRNTKDLDSCSRNFIGGDTTGIDYGPGTSDLDTRYNLGEY